MDIILYTICRPVSDQKRHMNILGVQYNTTKEFQLKASMWKAFQIKKKKQQQIYIQTNNHSIRKHNTTKIYKIICSKQNYTHSPIHQTLSRSWRQSSLHSGPRML